jgi:hypothetical protein
MAEKIILELKDKDFIKNSFNLNSPTTKKQIKNNSINNSLKQEIISTLANM